MGSGADAALVAGGLDAPDAVAADAAAKGLVMAHRLYGIPKPRGWSGAVFEALKVLHPQAAAHLAEHEDAEATLVAFWPEEAS